MPDSGDRAVAHAREPLVRVDTPGRRVALLGAALLALGGLLAWGDAPVWAWGPLALSGSSAVALVLGLLAGLQVASTASALSAFALVGLAWLGSAAALATRLEAAFDTGGALGGGMAVTVLGALVSVGGMELLRREAGLAYVPLARRTVELALQPKVQIALLKLFIPFALVGMFVLAILDLFGNDTATKLGAVFALYFFNPLGKEVAIPVSLAPTSAKFQGLSGLGLSPAVTWGFIVFVDLCTALFLVWNYDYALRIPYLGRVLAWVERRGAHAVEARPFIRRLAFFGVTAYALLPLEGTGAIGGSVVGRAIGLSPLRTFFAVGLGSLVRTTYTTLLVLGALSFLHL